MFTINLKIVLWIIISALLFGMSYMLIKKRTEKDIFKDDNRNNQSFKRINELLKKDEFGYFSYEKINSKLLKRGNPYNLNPAEYAVSKVLLSIIFFGIFAVGNAYLQGILSAALGFFIIDLLIYKTDKKEMRKIKFELADVYDAISIQTSAGVFIGTALANSYLIVKNKRLKRALTELAAEINITKDINKSLDNFSSKFSSIEIDSFSMIIKQSLVTGKSKQALDDMSNSLKDINLISVENETEKVNTVKTVFQLLMYIGILAIVIFGIRLELSKTWTGLFS